MSVCPYVCNYLSYIFLVLKWEYKNLKILEKILIGGFYQNPDPDHPPPLILWCFYYGQALWPPVIVYSTDIRRKLFGRKTTLLEAIGLLLLIFHNFWQIQSHHVILLVDNLSTVRAYKKKSP